MGTDGTRHIAVLLDTLQKHSFNRRLAHELVELAPRKLRLEIVDISRLSLYEPDAVASPPPAWKLFREQIKAADGLLFVTKENSRAISGVLRNALDIGSHPDRKNAWAGKPGGIMSVSTEGIARGAGNRQLRQALVSRNVPVMEPPDRYVTNGRLLFDPLGRLMSNEIHRFLQEYVDAFHGWVRSGYLH